MHYHLSSPDPEYYSYAAINAILPQAVENGRDHWKKCLNLGGLSSSEKNLLFKFKQNIGHME